MKKMNLPNKITLVRIALAVIVLVLLTVPWHQLGIEFPVYEILDVNVDLKYIISGVLFMIASITDFLDGHIARSRGLVTDFGKVMDAIADKVLVNGLLIILAYNGFISIVVPVVIITRDIVVDSIKMVSGSKGKVVAASWTGKIKTICMMVGITLVLFYNLPFEYFDLAVADLLVMIATILSVVSGCQYYAVNKDFVFSDK